jgi:hypothetical protein
MIYRTIIVYIFILTLSLIGFEQWGTSIWYEGCVAGFTLALVWHATKSTNKYLGIVGIIIFSATLFGLGNNLTNESRAFFNGMSLAMLPGLVVSALLRWNRFRPFLIMIARMEDHKWLLRFLGEE